MRNTVRVVFMMLGTGAIRLRQFGSTLPDAESINPA
jgi:hypothetical protein